MGVRTKQWLIAVLGAAITLAMLWLGLWQMRVFENKENESAAARAAQPAVPLLDFVSADGTVGDVYGKPVTVVGEYLAEQQVAVVAEDGSVRVLTAFQLADGRVLPVVRGLLAGPLSGGTPEPGQPDAGSPLPAPPPGELELTGIFLPSEAAAAATEPDEAQLPTTADPDEAQPPTTAEPDEAPGTLGTVRLAALAQLWPQQLLPGFVTLPASESVAQGLGEAKLALPSGEGSVQNAGYALQWWVFAAFAAFMTYRFVRTIGREGGLGTLSTQEEE